MMSFTEPETQALGAIADGLAGSDPRLASMLTIFSRLAVRNGAQGPRLWFGEAHHHHVRCWV